MILLDFSIQFGLILKCTKNRCFPLPQQTGASRVKTAKSLDSPTFGRTSVLGLSAYVGNLDVSLLRAPLRREVPRFAPYKQLRLPIAHECKDVDLAVWVSRVDGLDKLRRARGRVIKDVVAERGFGPAVHEVEVFLLEPEKNRYLGRLCYFRECPAAKRDCLAAGCGQQQFLKQHDNFSFWPQAIAEGAAVRLFDRGGGGIITQAADLPMVILDTDP